MGLKYFRVAFLGFGEFERTALASYFRLAAARDPHYQQVSTLTDADFLVADADDAPSVQLVVATERVAETVFIGSAAPPGAVAWMRRPIDALHVMRELDAMASALEHGTVLRVVQPPLPAAAEPAEPQEDAVAPEAEPPLDLKLELREAPLMSDSIFERVAALQAPDTDGLVAHEPAPPPTAVPPAPAPAPAEPPPPPRALLVDDSELALRFLEAHLQPWGITVDCAHHSGEALERLVQHSYDFIFLDVELGPNSPLDGLELCQHLKNSEAAMNALVIMVSAHHSELDRVRGALAGCDAYLGKPLDSTDLNRLLRRQGLKLPDKATAG